jgi:hypothetical protein
MPSDLDGDLSHSLLTALDHEFQDTTLPVTNLSFESLLIRDFQSPPSSLLGPPNALLAGEPVTNFALSNVQPSLSPSTPSSDFHSVRSVSTTASRTSAESAMVGVPEGKMQIGSLHSEFACSDCKKSFSKDLRFKQHLRRHCTAKHACKCGKSYTLIKDLRRHQGSSKTSASSCPATASEQRPKGFVCVCSRSFLRKDSLLRHINRELAKGNSLHRCQSNTKTAGLPLPVLPPLLNPDD